MPYVSRPRATGLALAAGVLATLTVGGGPAAWASSAVNAAAPQPQRVVTAVVIARRPGTVAPGTRVRSAQLGVRTFITAKRGFALAALPGAQYPAATVDGGRTWRTDGPALHVNAANAPLVVDNLGASSVNTVYAYGGGQALDATSNAGKRWYGALFQGLVMSVVPGVSGHLVAFIDGGSGASGPTWQYVSKNGGRTWRYDRTIGGS